MEDDVRFESSSQLAEMLESEGASENAKQILRKSVELAQNNPYWKCRLLFQLAVRPTKTY